MLEKENLLMCFLAYIVIQDMWKEIILWEFLWILGNANDAFHFYYLDNCIVSPFE